MYCPTCGTAEQSGRFCSACGARLPEEAAANTSIPTVTDNAAPGEHAPPAAGRADVGRVAPKTSSPEGPAGQSNTPFGFRGTSSWFPTRSGRSTKIGLGVVLLLLAVVIVATVLRASGPTMSSAELERRMTTAIAAEGFDSFVNCPDGEYKEGDVVVCEALLPNGLRQRFDATFSEKNGELRPEVGVPDP